MRASFLAVVLSFLSLGFARAQGTPPPDPPPVGDTLEFTNGDRLTGKLVRAEGTDVVFHSDMAGDITVPFSKVKQLRSGVEFVALKPTTPGRYQAVGTGAVSFADNLLTLTPNKQSGNSGVHTIEAKDLGYLVNVQTYAREVGHGSDPRYGWTGAATAGFTLVRATQSSTTFTGALNFVRQVPTVPYLPKRSRTTFNLNETFGTNTSPVIPPTVPATPAVVVKTNIFHADAEHDRYFSPRLYALADAAVDHNFAQGLQFQQLYGGGLGWTALQDARQQLDLKGDVHYERQQFIQTAGTAYQPTLNLIGSLFQENYHRNLPSRIVLTQWLNVSPSWSNFNAYSANAYLGLALPVYKRLNVTLSATDNYLNNPALYYRKNSIQYVMGATYAFK